MKRTIATFIIVVIALYLGWALLRPLPALSKSDFHLSVQSSLSSPKLSWPAFGQSAVGLAGTSVLLNSGPAAPVPTASTAKLITSLVVLAKYPLLKDQPGPSLTLSPSDVNLYTAYQAAGGSVTPVVNGEKLSEQQALIGMLLPSANNLADSLAIWAYGSLANYKLAAINYLKDQGLNETQIGPDASGFNPSTTSTAHDLVKIGELAISQPAIASIVSQPSATLPVAGLVKNYNFLLGSHGISGLKTGNNDADKGAFVSASKVMVNNLPVTIITATLGSPSLNAALNGSLPLITSAQANFGVLTKISPGQPVGSLSLPWGSQVPVKATTILNIAGWLGSQASLSVKLTNLNQHQANQIVGYLNASTIAPKFNRSIPIALSTNLPRPSLLWRLKHPAS